MAGAAAGEDAVFDKITEEQDLEMLADKIRGDCPRSTIVLNILLMHAKGYADQFNFYVLRNKPDANVVMLLNQDRSMMTVYCPEEQEIELLQAISNTQLKPLEALNTFSFVPESLRERVCQLMKATKLGEIEVFASDCFYYDIVLCAGDFICPANFTVARMNGKASLFMEAVAQTDYNYSDLDQFKRLYHVAPCVTIFTSTGEPRRIMDLSKKLSLNKSGYFSDHEDVDVMEPLAWACINSYGQLGILCSDKSELHVTLGCDIDFLRNEAPVLNVVTNVFARLMVQEGFVVISLLKTPNCDLSAMQGWHKLVTTFDIVMSRASNRNNP